jgi:hypothetical protein
MNWLRPAQIIVGIGLLGIAGCGGSGGGGGNGSPTDAAFLFMTEPNSGGFTLQLGKISDPSHPVALRTLPVNKILLGAAYDPVAGKIYYHDSSNTTDVNVVNADGTGDQVFYSHAGLSGVGTQVVNGKLRIGIDSGGGNITTYNLDLSSKTISVAPAPGTPQEPAPGSPQWRKDDKFFAYLWLGDNSQFQLWKMNVATNQGTFIGDNVFGGQYAPNNTLVGPDALLPGLDRYSESGSFIKRYVTDRDFTDFAQVGSNGFIIGGSMGSPAPNIEYFKYGGSSAINLTPTISDRVVLVGDVTYPIAG